MRGRDPDATVRAALPSPRLGADARSHTIARRCRSQRYPVRADSIGDGVGKRWWGALKGREASDFLAFSSILALVALASPSVAHEGSSDGTVQQIIESYVKDFRSDRFAAQPTLFGMEGWQPPPEEYASINPFSFHFWTRGFPEVVPFGADPTRTLHGSPIVGLYYETGLRTAPCDPPVVERHR